MYLESVRLENVKCFEDIRLTFQTSRTTGDRQSNWNVVIGNNGDGKTSLLQAIAACLMDAATAGRVLQPSTLVRKGVQTARLTARLVKDEKDARPPGRPGREGKKGRTVQYVVVGANQEILLSRTIYPPDTNAGWPWDP